MKTLPAIAAVSIAMALLLVPLATTASGSITFSSPASGASLKGSQSYTISGTVTPTPTQPDEVGIVVKNPSGQVVDQDTATVTNGAFSYATAVGGSPAWVSGVYTITGTDSFGATGTTSFTYTATTSSFNETQALIDIMGNQSIIEHNQANILGNLSALSSAVSALSGAVSTLTSTVGTISTNVGTILSDINSLSSTVGQINTNVGTLSSQLPSAGTISNTQTYVLVVAVLAAITLVLELAILVRKIS
jgi:phage-related minor tail protein